MINDYIFVGVFFFIYFFLVESDLDTSSGTTESKQI